MTKNKFTQRAAITALSFIFLSFMGGHFIDAAIISRPTIYSFTTNSSSINSGQTAMLSWSVGKAQSVFIDQEVGNVTGLSSIAVAPKATTTYVLTATNESGLVTASVTIMVNTANPGTVINECGEISQPGNYVVGRDLQRVSPSLQNAPCLRIHDVSNVNLDCQGHTVEAINAFDGAISLSNVNDFSICNCVIKKSIQFGDGSFQHADALQISNSHRGRVSDNKIEGLLINSIYDTTTPQPMDSSEIVISGNFFSTYIHVISAHGIEIESNRFKMPSSPTVAGAISFIDGHHNIVRNNQIDGSWDGDPGTFNVGLYADDGIILYNEDNDLIENNEIVNNWDCGIETLGYFTNSTIRGNTIKNCLICGIGGWYYGNSWHNNLIKDNTFEEIGYMFTLYKAGAYQPIEHPYMTSNTFQGNKLVSAHRSFSPLLPAASFDLPIEYDFSGNTFSNNDFGTRNPPPSFVPLSGVVDGGGNICAQGMDSAYPFACGRPVQGVPIRITGIGASPHQVKLPHGVDLSAIVDGGLRPGWTVLWVASGPGNVSFGNSASLQTSASFTMPGIYIFKVTVSADTGQSAFAATTVIVEPDSLPEGVLEQCDCKALSGWAVDADIPETAMTVEIYTDGNATSDTLVAKGTANLPRFLGKLSIDSVGRGRGFNIPFPDKLKDGFKHNLYAYVLDAENGSAKRSLRGSPVVRTCKYAVPQEIAYNGSDAPVQFLGNGWVNYALSGAYFNDEKCTDSAGAFAKLSFLNSDERIAGFKVYAAKAYNRAKMEIYIDGVSKGLFDAYDPGVQIQQLIFDSGQLPVGAHEIKIVNRMTDPSKPYIGIDKIVVSKQT